MVHYYIYILELNYFPDALFTYPLVFTLQIPIALDMAKDSNGKDRELKKRIELDVYMSCAVQECYASCQKHN